MYADQDPIGVNITGHLPGPSGAAIAEGLEEDPDNLLLPVNDDFDERLRTSGIIRADMEKNSIDTVQDGDFLRLKLSVATTLPQGVVHLVGLDEIDREFPLTTFPLTFFTEDGQTPLESSDFSVDLANPGTSKLAGVNAASGVTFLVEAREGVEAMKVVLKYELNQSIVDDSLIFHAVDVDFLEAGPPGALDDDDENQFNPLYGAMMVPLSGDEQSSGSGKVRVTVASASLAGNVGSFLHHVNGIVGCFPGFNRLTTNVSPAGIEVFLTCCLPAA